MTSIEKSHESPAIALVIRCKGKRAEVYVDANEVVTPDLGVRIKFDQGKPTRQFWKRGADYDSLFAPDPADFLRKMRSANLLYFEYTPHGKIERVVSFNISGLPQGIRDACVNTEIEKADAQSERLRTQQKLQAQEQAKLLAEQKQEREENQKRLLDLRAKCSSFQHETTEAVARGFAPLPPEECWEEGVLDWTGSDSYQTVVKRREVCKLPSFARDPKFCGPTP